MGDYVCHAFSRASVHDAKTSSVLKMGSSSSIVRSFYDLQASVNAATFLPDAMPDADQKPFQ